MTRDEVKQIVMVIAAAYPNFHPDNVTFLVSTWYQFLKDYDAAGIQSALHTYILTNASGFAPSVGQLISEYQKNQERSGAVTYLNEQEAWSMVSSAIRRSGYNSLEEFNKLPEEVQQAVGSADSLHTMAVDENYNESVQSAHFVNAYKIVLKRKKENDSLPQNVMQRLRGEINERIGEIQRGDHTEVLGRSINGKDSK